MEKMLLQRLSNHFTLLDFLNAHTFYTSGHPLSRDDFMDGTLISGRKMCEELLEPLVKEVGPMSFSSGYIPRHLLSERWTPHRWTTADGAATDVIVHDWVNAGKAPIKLVEGIVASQGVTLDFERLITYAGSEVICMAAGRDRNRGVVYENVRIPGADKPQFKTWRRAGQTGNIRVPDRPDWRRLDGEPVYHTRRALRPQHVRVGEYFTFLDFARDIPAMLDGRNWVPPHDRAPLVQMAQCMAEVLDPVKKVSGHLTVIQGPRMKSYAQSPAEMWHGEVGEVRFMLPYGRDLSHLDHSAVTEAEEYAKGRWRVVVKRFEPKRQWSSAIVVRQRKKIS
jgi:hypothetical protein